MSRAEVLATQEAIRDPTVVGLDNRSEKDIKFAVQGLILEGFFLTSDFYAMQAELVNIVPDITLLGVSLLSIEEKSIEITVRHLNAASKTFFETYPAIVALCSNKGISTNNLFEATGTGLTILTTFARDILTRTTNPDEFIDKYNNIINNSAKKIASHSIQVMSADVITIGLFQTPDYLRDSIKRVLYDNFTDSKKFKESMLAYFDGFNEDLLYNAYAAGQYRKARCFVAELNPSEMKSFIQAYIEIKPYYNKYLKISDLDPKLSSLVLNVINDKKFQAVLNHLPRVEDLIREYDQKIDFPSIEVLSNVTVIKKEYILIGKDGRISVDIDLFKNNMRTYDTETILRVHELELQENGNLVAHGCPGLHERTDEENPILGKRVGMIDIAAHAIATVISKNWDLIQKKGFL